jgi:hypothetical protein
MQGSPPGKLKKGDSMIEQTLPRESKKLADVQAEHEEALLARQNVVGVALGNKITEAKGDTGEQVITVLVESKLDEDLLSKDEIVPKTIGGVKTDVQEVGVIQAGGPAATAYPELMIGGYDVEFTPNGAGTAVAPPPPVREPQRVRIEEEIRPTTLALRARPAKGGYSVGHYQITAGTIATGCYDWGSFPDVPPAYYLLSNNHVLANSNLASVGDPILQPGPYDGGTIPADVIGRLARFVPIRFIPPTPPVPLNLVDAAIAQVQFHDLDREVYWIGYIKTLYMQPKVGDVVQKTGRTTNFTTGRVTNINATVDVNYGSGRVARFARQIIAQTQTGRAMGAGGDSGSLVTSLDEEGVGLLFAGSPTVTIINHLHFVQNLLKVRITEK